MTNGPMLSIEAGGHQAGDEIKVGVGDVVRIDAEAGTASVSATIYREEALFDALMSEEVEGSTLRTQLRDPKLRPRVRRTVRERIRVAD